MSAAWELTLLRPAVHAGKPDLQKVHEGAWFRGGWRDLCLRSHLQGYLSHKMRTLVLSKQNAFPSLSTVAADDTRD